MKFPFTILFALNIFFSILSGQDIVSEKFNTDNIERIEVVMDYGDVEVLFKDIDEVEITYNITINNKAATKAISLKDKRRNGVLKLNSEIDFDQVEAQVTYTDKENNQKSVTAKVFERLNIFSKNCKDVNYGYDMDGHISIVLPIDKAITLKTTYGDMDIKYDDLPKDHNLDVHSTYGHVDLSIPEDVASNLELETSYGEIYTNHHLETKNSRSKKPQFGDQIVAVINEHPKGSIKIEATYDNIYLRKN